MGFRNYQILSNYFQIQVESYEESKIINIDVIDILSSRY